MSRPSQSQPAWVWAVTSGSLSASDSTRQGDVYAADDPLVARHPAAFSSEPPPWLLKSTASQSAEPGPPDPAKPPPMDPAFAELGMTPGKLRKLRGLLGLDDGPAGTEVRTDG